MDSTILKGGIEELETIKQNLIEQGRYVEEKKALEDSEKQLEKSIQKREKEVENEIAKTIRNRKKELEKTLDEQIDKVNVKVKKVQSIKERSKRKAVDERILYETADHKTEEKDLNLTGKSIFKQKSIPRLYNNRLFFALYFPRGLGDWGIILITLFIAFFVIPFALYHLVFGERDNMFLGLSYFMTIVVLGGTYIVLGKMKCKHKEALDSVRQMRKKIGKIRKEQKKIKKQIRRDKDESVYGLDEYDSELQKLSFEINELLERKKKSLLEFDELTAVEIKGQIKLTHVDELNQLSEALNSVYAQKSLNSENSNRVNLLIASQYESYLGKEFVSMEKIQQMEELLSNGQAATLSDAISMLSKKEV